MFRFCCKFEVDVEILKLVNLMDTLVESYFYWTYMQPFLNLPGLLMAPCLATQISLHGLCLATEEPLPGPYVVTMFDKSDRPLLVCPVLKPLSHFSGSFATGRTS